MGANGVMYVVPPEVMTAVEVRQLSSALTAAVGYGRFDLRRDEDRHALSIADDPFSPLDMLDQVLEVDFAWTRYYGVGYERGPLWTYVAVASWFLHRGFQVWYGADYNEHVEEFDGEALIEHWCEHGHDPYTGAHTGPECSFCLRRSHRCGAERGKPIYRCSGCGEYVE